MAVRLFEGKHHATAYLQHRVTPQELVDKIMNYMKQKTSSKYSLAVDVGCGSGQGTVLLAPYFTKVVGTDVSPAQLEAALTNNNPPNVSYSECPAEDLPFASGEVDLVAAMTSAHWFDRPRFLQEADRVLRPGGCLAVLGYTMDMELEHGEFTNALNDVCKEFYAALRPYRDPHIGSSSLKIYENMYDSCTYPDKEWTECYRVKRIVSLNGYVSLVETFSPYQIVYRKDPAEAERLSDDIRKKLVSAMKGSPPETEITMIVNFYYWFACKPLNS